MLGGIKSESTGGNRVSSRALNKLSDTGLRAWVKKAQNGKSAAGMLSDGGGMYLTLTGAGTPVWRLKYRLGGKEKVFSIGAYPSVSLEAARAEREQAKAQIREGRDPTQVRKVSQAEATAASGDTFEKVSADWLAKRKAGWGDTHYEKSLRALERDVYPKIGKLPVAEISPAIMASVFEAIDKRGARETAGRILQHVSGIFRLAQARGQCRDNPAEPVREVLSRKKAEGHRPALLKWDQLGAVMRSAETANLSRAVRLAHRLTAFSVARISNVVQVEWPEFDLEAKPALWVIPRKKMKSKNKAHDHKIILPDSITAELREWKALTGGRGYVFRSPADPSKHISREALEKVYRVTLGLADKHTPHGWRAAFSTLARDHGFERDVVELAQDRIHDNDVVRAYDRGERWQQRVRLMAWWGEELSQAQRGAEVVRLKTAAA